MNVKRILVAATAGVAALALAGAAVAAGPPKAPPRAALHQVQGPAYGLMAGGVVMEAAADYIGISETALATARHSGKSLAQIATDNGKTAAGLEQALVAAVKTNLDKAVAAGRITSAQAAQILARFQVQVKTSIARTTTGPLTVRGAGMGLGLGLGACGGRR